MQKFSTLIQITFVLNPMFLVPKIKNLNHFPLSVQILWKLCICINGIQMHLKWWFNPIVEEYQKAKTEVDTSLYMPRIFSTLQNNFASICSSHDENLWNLLCLLFKSLWKITFVQVFWAICKVKYEYSTTITEYNLRLVTWFSWWNNDMILITRIHILKGANQAPQVVFWQTHMALIIQEPSFIQVK